MTVAAGRWAARRSLDEAARRRALCGFTAVTLLLVLLTSKVFSPQYLIWCLPLFGVLGQEVGRVLFRGLCAALFLTQIYFPFLYTPLVNGAWPLLLLVLGRNLLLLAMAVLALRALLAGPRREGPAC
jgi:hypothetical protein